MADHVRAQIRAALLAILKAEPLTRNRVFVTRRLPLQPEHLPALLIYGLTEDSTPETMSVPFWLSRELDIQVEGVAQDNDDLDITLDQLATAAETRIAAAFADAASQLRSLVRACYLTRTQVGVRPPQNADEAGTGHVVMTFRVNYRTRSDNPTTII